MSQSQSDSEHSEHSDISIEKSDDELQTRQTLTLEAIEIVKSLRSEFKQIDSPICCFGHVSFQDNDPKIFYSVPPTLATSDDNLDPSPQAKG